MENKLDIIVFSDCHGELPIIKKEFDLMLICGDIFPTLSHNVGFQYYWLNEVFYNWYKNLPYKNENSRIVLIPGNHDFLFEKSPDIMEPSRSPWSNVEAIKALTVLLVNEEYTFKSNGRELKIFGTPYCKKFGNWAFLKEYDELKDIYSRIPEDVDILMTHDAPDISGLGMITEGRWKGENAGNTVLAEEILKKKPKYVFCGHIHSGNHNWVETDGIKLKNVSLMDENYNIKNNPLIINY